MEVVTPHPNLDYPRLSYDHILIPTDGSEVVDPAITHGGSLARSCAATIHAVHVVEVDRERWEAIPSRQKEQRRWEGTEAIEPILKRAHRSGINVISAVEPGRPSEVIGSYTKTNDIDLTIMGTHGRTGVSRVLHGSVCERTIRIVPTPVLAVTHNNATPDSEEASPIRYQDVLLCCDGGQEACLPHEHAFEIARNYRATVHGLFIVDRRGYTSRPYYTWDRTIDSQERLGKRVLTDVKGHADVINVDVRTTMINGVPPREILGYAAKNDIDLIVMGTRGLTGFDRFLYRSVSDHVIRNASVPVLVVPSGKSGPVFAR